MRCNALFKMRSNGAKGNGRGDSGFAVWPWRIAGGENNAKQRLMQRLVRTADLLPAVDALGHHARQRLVNDAIRASRCQCVLGCIIRPCLLSGWVPVLPKFPLFMRGWCIFSATMQINIKERREFHVVEKILVSFAG
jgi:hypothetical protein